MARGPIYFLVAGVLECLQAIHVDFAFSGHQCGEQLGNLDRFRFKNRWPGAATSPFLISSLKDSKLTAVTG